MRDANALTGDTRISIRVVDPAEHPTFAAGEAVDGSVHALEPHGLEFLSPVTLSLPADTSRGGRGGLKCYAGNTCADVCAF